MTSWVDCRRQGLLHSDNGILWTSVSSPVKTLKSCFSITGWVVGARGNRLAYKRCRDQLTFRRTNTFSWLEDVFFLDEQHGVIVGSGGTILRTEWRRKMDQSGSKFAGIFLALLLQMRNEGISWALAESFAD